MSAGFATRRVLLALGLGLAGGVLAAVFLPWQAATLLGWDTAAAGQTLRQSGVCERMDETLEEPPEADL